MEDLLVEMPDNPVPVGTIGGILNTEDGISLRYALFSALPDRNCRGTVIILHGRNECIEKYFETVQDLRNLGFASATFDWRGQGGSSRLIRDRVRGYVDSFHDFVSDFEKFFREVVLPDCRGPYFILAHSTGALVAQLAAPNLSNRVNRMLLSAPMLGLATLPVSQKIVHTICSFLYSIGLGRLYAAGGPRPRETKPFDGNLLTSDPGRYRRNSNLYEARPELALGGPTAAWINAAFNAINQVTDRDFCMKIRVPMMFVVAGADRIVSNKAIERQANRLRSGSLITIDGAQHEILQERDLYREQLLAAADAYLTEEPIA